MPDIYLATTRMHTGSSSRNVCNFWSALKCNVDISTCGCATCIDDVAIDSRSIVGQFA